MEQRLEQTFSKENTALVKGMAILCMLFYHLFETYADVEEMGVNYAPLSQETFMTLSGFGNICVAVFAFLSAYGISKSLLALIDDDIKSWYRYSAKRYLKLLVGFVSVYLSVNIIWFTKFDYSGLYGKGWPGAVYGIVDALGLAQIFETPTLCNTWWYMEIAVIIIFITPILLKFTKKMGSYIIILGVLAPALIELPYDFKRYYLVILIGVVAANEKWFERIRLNKIPLGVKYILGLAVLASCVVLRQNYLMYNQFAYILDAPIAFVFALIGRELFDVIPGIRNVLMFLGKHSMNIYFVHSFFYLILYRDFVYSFKFAPLIFFVLTLICLAYSMCLEGLKLLVSKLLEKRKCR